MHNFLDFEKPVAELEGKIAELRHISDDGEINIADEITRLETTKNKQLRQLYSKLTPWQKTQVARHSDRPHFSDYVNAFVTDFVSLSGDRNYAEDKAIIGGIGRIEGRSVMVIGQEKGSDTQSRVTHNFGMAKPEGYRKAQRLMQMAERFNLPVITLVDTAGAYPGVGAEERGQSEAIARSIEVCLKIRVPLISVIIGEGGSGGAIALASANHVLMLEHAIYSVISPEGCASILWRSADQAKEAAEALKLTAQDLMRFGVLDGIIPEPLGGAHRSRDEAIESVRLQLVKSLEELTKLDGDALRKARREKFIEIGHKGLV